MKKHIIYEARKERQPLSTTSFRCDSEQKNIIMKLAKKDDCDLSDIVRQFFHMYIECYDIFFYEASTRGITVIKHMTNLLMDMKKEAKVL